MDIIVERISELIGKKHGAKKEFADAIGVSQNPVKQSILTSLFDQSFLANYAKQPRQRHTAWAFSYTKPFFLA